MRFFIRKISLITLIINLIVFWKQILIYAFLFGASFYWSGKGIFIIFFAIIRNIVMRDLSFFNWAPKKVLQTILFLFNKYADIFFFIVIIFRYLINVNINNFQGILALIMIWVSVRVGFRTAITILLFLMILHFIVKVHRLYPALWNFVFLILLALLKLFSSLNIVFLVLHYHIFLIDWCFFRRFYFFIIWFCVFYSFYKFLSFIINN